MPRVWNSSWIFTPSFASTAWWRPSLQRRPSMMRPVNSSTIFTSPSWITYSTSRWKSDCGLERLDEVVDELRVLRRVEVVDPQRALDLLDAVLRDADGLELLVVLVVGADLLGVSLRVAGRRAMAVELRGDAREVVVDLRGGLGLAGDDERRPRLVDEDRVDLVDDRVDVAALDARVERDGHVVAEVVEAELRVRPVRDVRLVRGLLLLERLHRLDRARPSSRATRTRAGSTRRRAARGSRSIVTRCAPLPVRPLR